jgi:hypothetical protein
MNVLLERMIRAAKLDANLYEEVEADPSLMKEAGLVVILSSIAAGIGTITQAGISGLIFGTIAALVGWFIWAYLTMIIGTKLLPVPETDADYGQLLRTIGFSSSPGVARVLGIIPGIGPIIQFVVGIWMLAAMVVAVRQALDYSSTGRAILVCIIGWIIQFVVLALFFSLVT